MKKPYRNDLFLIAGLLLIAGLFYFGSSIRPVTAPVAEIYQGKELVQTIPLDSVAKLQVISLENEVETVITCQNQSIQITSASCPDQTCVKTGKISRPGQSAVCLPGKVSIVIQGKPAKQHSDSQTF